MVPGALPAPYAIAPGAIGRPYRIGAYDKIEVEVFGVAEFERREIVADSSGRVSIPLVGAIQAAGMTPDELAEAIRSGLDGRFVRNPQVSVNLVDPVSQTVTVDGQVTEPGQYPVVGGMTLIRAVARAKGVSEFADLEDVVVLRDVEGQRYAGLYNLGAIRRGTYADPEIFANDVIVVGDSPQRRLFRDVLQASPLLTAPLVLLAR